MRVFLSYRRADSLLVAGRMAQFLESVDAVKDVFLDVDDVEAGEDYEQRIRRTLAVTSHAFVLIGQHWCGPAGASGLTRIHEADDVVRLETRLLLQGRVRLIPVLIDGARMPTARELPEDLQPLAKINATVLRSTHFDRDMDELLDALHGGAGQRGSRWRRRPLGATAIAVRALGGLAAGAALLLAAALLNRHVLRDCYDLVCRLKTSFGVASDDDALGLLWLIATAVLLVCALLPFAARWLSRRR